MTTVETEQPTAPATLVRHFPADLDVGDGRTIDGQIVPYNVAATVCDHPTMPSYREMFMPGAFTPQLSAANRVDVLLNFEHRQSLGDVIGHGTTLEDRTDGLYGSFRVLAQPDGDKALELVREGVLTGLSVEFLAKRSKTVGGVVQRLDARVRNVALCRDPAYPESQVLAVRQAPVIHVPERDTSRLEALGIEPLFRANVVSRFWNGDRSRYTDDQYQAACILEGVPVLEPNGDLNMNALKQACAAVVKARDQSAARKLIRYYRLADLTPPPGLVTLAA